MRTPASVSGIISSFTTMFLIATHLHHRTFSPFNTTAKALTLSRK